MGDPAYDKSKFNLGYFLQPKAEDTFKSLKYGLTFVLICGLLFFIIYGAYRLWKPSDNKQVIKVEKGGTATIVQKTGDKKWFTLFVEPYAGVSTNTKSEGRGEIGSRFGCRVEF